MGDAWHHVTGSAVEVRTREATGESAASVAMEAPEYWVCQHYGMCGKASSRCGASLSPRQIVCLQRAEPEKWGCLNLSVSRRCSVNLRCQTLSYRTWAYSTEF